MKAESNISPQQIVIEPHDDILDVVLSENIILINRDGGGMYQYDQYRITVRNRLGLQADVNAHLAEWFAFARAKAEVFTAQKALAVTSERNRVDINTYLKQAITDNKTFLALPTPTVADRNAQINKAARQLIRIERLLLNQLDSVE